MVSVAEYKKTVNNKLNSAPVAYGGGTDTSTNNKTPLIKRLAKRSRAIKLSGGYLDYMHYYFSNESEELLSEYDAKQKVHYCRQCQHTWVEEARNDVTRFRGIGCGDRNFCPLCGNYSQIVYSRESARQIELILEAIDVNSGNACEYESLGLKIVLTIPKTESERIDKLLFDGKPEEWSGEVNALYKAGYAWLNRCFPGVPGSMSMDYTGESAPTEAHYHLNIYLLPVKLDKNAHFEAISHYFNEVEFEAMRGEWRDIINTLFGLELPEVNIRVGYIGRTASLYHWLRYEYRHPLSDIWRGWRGYGEALGMLTYSYKKQGKTIELQLSNEQLNTAFRRVELIPKHFKRIRWFGALSDGNRGKTLASLGLEKRERSDTDTGEGDDSEWRVERYLGFVKYASDGIILELRDDHGCGTGQYLKVLDDSLNYSPKGVKVGRRTVWVEPGGY